MSLRFAPLSSVVAALLVLVGAPGARASEHLTAPTAEAAEADALLAALAAPWTGDLDGMIERGFVRVGVSHAPLFFTYDGANPSGLNVDLAAAFEAHLRETLGPTARHLTVVLAPLPRDRMLPALIEGRVDLLNANLTVTPAREALVDFGDPFRGAAREIVVPGPAAGDVATLDDLAAFGLHVRRSSSYFDHVAALNVRRVAEGLAPIAVAEADERLEDLDLLELVDAGVIPAIIVDEAKVEIYAQVMEHLVPHPDLVVDEGGRIAWAMRKGSPQLRGALDGFVKKARQGTALGNRLLRRWFESEKRLRNALAEGEDARYLETIALIRRHAASYGFDPLTIAAQGYQESRLDQSVRSPVGAVGIMQVMPVTASDPNVRIPDIHIAERNVEAGVKYLDFLRRRYLDVPAISEFDRAMMSFAAYNMGPGNLAKSRRRAEAMGLDPNVWFGNVEIAAGRAVSREPVTYVRDILKYYVTYELFERRAGERGG